MRIPLISLFSAHVNGANPGAIVGGIFSCILILTLVGWVGYAYFNPNTSSGRFLIKVRTPQVLSGVRKLTLIVKSIVEILF